MKDKICKSFEDWFNKEDFHANGYDCNQAVSAKLAWNARNLEIDSLKLQIKKYHDSYKKLCSDLYDGEYVTLSWIKDTIELQAEYETIVKSCHFLEIKKRNAEIQELKDKVEKCKLSLLNCEKYIDKEFYKIMDTYTKCAHTNFILDNINSSVRDDLKKTLKELKELGERE